MHRDPRFDSTLALMRDPYGFVRTQCLRFGEDLFETRIVLQKTSPDGSTTPCRDRA